MSAPIQNSDVTATAKNPAFKFSEVATYTLPDTVQVVHDETTPPDATTISSTLSSFIISQVQSHLNALGYQQLTDPNGPKPSVFVDVSVMQTTHTDVYYSGWYGYWGAYYTPWYGSSVGVGYAPGYYPYVVETTLGSVIVNMTDPNHPDPTTNTIPSAWVGVVNGAVTGGSEASTQTRIESGLNEAFKQSPYLAKGASP